MNLRWYKLRKKYSRREAKLVLTCMQEVIDKYGWVTLSDFFDLVDYKSTYLDNKTGWRSLNGSRVSLIRYHGSYWIGLPRSEDITYSET